MSYIHPNVLDQAANYIINGTENFYLCSAEPSTFTEASATYKLGTKASPSLTGPAAGDVSGRKLTVSAFTDGAVSADGTASHWALTDDSLTMLLAAGPLDASQAVYDGNTFEMEAFDLEFEDPA